MHKGILSTVKNYYLLLFPVFFLLPVNNRYFGLIPLRVLAAHCHGCTASDAKKRVKVSFL